MNTSELAKKLMSAANTTAEALDRLNAFPGDGLIDLSQHEGEQVDADITTINEWYELASPANVKRLVDELEGRDALVALQKIEIRETHGELEKARERIAELEKQNEHTRKRYQELDLLIGKNILVMQAAIIEWQATGDAKNGLAWIYNTLFGPGELPDEAEKDAQAYFDRKYAPIDEELMALHRWFWEQRKPDAQEAK